MSLTPDTATEPKWTRRLQLRRRLWLVCFAIFAFEIGAFLVVFPWMDSWSLNHLPSFFPSLQLDFQGVWDEPFLRAGVSGLGIVNVYIAFLQVWSLVRSARKN